MKKKCPAKTEVYSRVVGFYRPVQQWNNGKREEYRQRKVYKIGEWEILNHENKENK